MGISAQTVGAPVAGCSAAAIIDPKCFRASHGLTHPGTLVRLYLFGCSHFVAPCVFELVMFASHGEVQPVLG